MDNIWALILSLSQCVVDVHGRELYEEGERPSCTVPVPVSVSVSVSVSLSRSLSFSLSVSLSICTR